MVDSNQQDTLLKTAAGVAGGAVLFSPVGMPIVHGLAGIAVASLGIMAAGSVVGAITDNIGNALSSRDKPERGFPEAVDEYDSE